MRFPHSISVIEIPGGLREQKHLLMGLSGPIRHGLRHRVRFRPNDLGAEIPAIGTKGERQQPRDADQIFRLEVRALWNLARVRPGIRVAAIVNWGKHLAVDRALRTPLGLAALVAP